MSHEPCPPVPAEPAPDPTRRRLLRGALALPAALALGGVARAQYGKGGGSRGDEPAPAPAGGGDGAQEGGELDPKAIRAQQLEAFYERWIPRAHRLVRAQEPEIDSFLFELGADLVKRDSSFFPKRSMTLYDEGGMTVGPVGRDDVFQLIEIRLAPGTVVPAHNHVRYAFVTFCVEGEVRARHFEPEEGAPDEQTLEEDFLVREVTDSLLTPGRFTTLAPTRANVHELTAGPEGARIIDFGVKFKQHVGGPRAFSVLEVDPDPADAARQTYPARWIGNVYAKGWTRGGAQGGAGEQGPEQGGN